MDYMYRGEVNISQDQLAALLKAAESLQIKGLSDSRSGGPMPSSHKSDGKSSHVPAPKVSFMQLNTFFSATLSTVVSRLFSLSWDDFAFFFGVNFIWDEEKKAEKNVQQTMNSSFLSYYNNDY